MVIFDGSWYGRVLDERVVGTVPEKAWREAYRDILEFERMLADDGTVILKFFLHISKKEQKKRFRGIGLDPLESWRITATDWARHERYDEYLAAAEEMLELTESEYGPWTIVEATSRWYARKRIFESLTTPICGRPWIFWAATTEETPNAGDTRFKRVSRSRHLCSRSDPASDSITRTGLSGVLAETSGGDCI
jgi:hypothetical protein